MFYGFVKSQWEAGKVSVALPAPGKIIHCTVPVLK